MNKILAIIAIWLLAFTLDSVEPSCMKQLETEFFQPIWVNQAMAMHNISQSAWPEINRVLRDKVKKVPQLVRQRAQKMTPNPLETPFQWQEASHLLRQVLLEVFAEALVEFNIKSPGLVFEMFEYIMNQQRDRWIACFGEEEPK